MYHTRYCFNWDSFIRSFSAKNLGYRATGGMPSRNKHRKQVEQQTHHQYSHENRRTEEELDAYIKIRSGSTIAKHPVLTQP